MYSCAPVFKFFPALPDGATTEYQISNRGFSDFLRTYYCDFLNNMYMKGSFFCRGNVQLKRILPVLKCVDVGIAFVSSKLSLDSIGSV